MKIKFRLKNGENGKQIYSLCFRIAGFKMFYLNNNFHFPILEILNRNFISKSSMIFEQK